MKTTTYYLNFDYKNFNLSQQHSLYYDIILPHKKQGYKIPCFFINYNIIPFSFL